MHIGVIGAGTAGRQFAADCAVAGLSVTLEDVMPSRLRSAQAVFTSLGRHVRLVTTVEDAVAEADIAIDFVPDELESKLEIFSLLDRMAPPRTILCTPSQLLSITDLASCTYRPDRCVMIRNLIQGIQPLQLLKGRQTSGSTGRASLALFQALQRPCTILDDPDLPQLMKNMGDAALAASLPATSFRIQ